MSQKTGGLWRVLWAYIACLGVATAVLFYDPYRSVIPSFLALYWYAVDSVPGIDTTRAVLVVVLSLVL